ncbi:uncharacterized protein LOC117651764 [Thrips palmi]|uniref:Uncharacterized protein LOC117651764 n=1 Tax=Thrips palmi TaxID=161013 RepID=A0A6P9A3E9_THRPL|nr:uncharacterized protein LOC117651764 [Thrips palmi]
MAETGPELIVQCPYEKSHRVRRAIFPMHLAKCARDAKYALAKCSFNYTHHVRQEELEEHEKNCPDRYSFEASLVQIKEDNYLAIPFEHIELPPSTENWDDGAVNHFNPKAVTNSEDREKFVIRTRHCLAPAERKAFRSKQIEEAQHFEENQKLVAPQPTIPPGNKVVPLYERLRRPMSASTSATSNQPSSAPDSITRFFRQKQSLSPAATASLDLVPVPTKEVSKDPTSVTVSEQPTSGWLSTGRGKAIVALRNSLDSHVLPVGFGRGKNVCFM